MSSSRSSDHLPKLKSANFESLGQDVEVNYKSGASFKGKVQDHKRSGTGIFTWPNGAKYEGQYSDNLRNGKGLQIWQDGSKYNGDFRLDMRHGEGELSWSNGEIYKGTFFRDRRHGKGVYTWPNGSTYTGTFYMDRKEGYGLFKFANGNTFEGLYKDDEREGPGVLTYTDGTQDVGLWHGEKLIKLCTSSPNAFMMEDHKEFDYNPDEHIEYIKAEPDQIIIPEFVESPEIFDYLPENNVMETVMNLYNDSLDPRSLAVNKDIFDTEFFKGSEREKDDKDEKIKAWNKTPSMIDIQQHVHKHRHQQKNMSFNIDKIVKGDRSKFKKKGPLETASEQLIESATNGDEKVVEDLLTAGNVHPDVADKDGHTPLIGATVNWHIGVINCLLNHGADVNKLNDEGCSALSAGAIFFYPVDSFLFNIAERYLDGPSAVSKKSKKDIKQTGRKSDDKGINKQKQKTDGYESPSQKQKTDKKVKVPPGVSTTSVDSGFYQSDSNQSIGAPQGKLQVRIKEPVAGETTLNENEEELDSVLGEQKNEEDVEFDSTATLHDFEIEVTEQLIERCATQLSTNEKIVKGRRSHNSADLGTVRHLAVIKNEKERMKQTLDLLLKRGADPNASNVPMPVLFFAIKSADVEVVKKLLLKGASTMITLPKEKGGLAPLHIACAIPGEEGVQITELLLNALADPDVRATEDDSFLNKTLEEEWMKDSILPESQALLGGRTPLQIACARDDNYKHACRIVHLLLEHKANSNLLCNGFSPLALAIASGNDLAIDELLAYHCDPSLPLTHGLGSAICAATSTEYEHRRPIQARLDLIDKLVKAGGNILASIPIGPKRIMGTAVDYAYYMFNQDRRIAHMPYHALTPAERETYNARRKLLAHIGDILRTKAVEREKKKLEDELSAGKRSRSPSPGFVYIGAGAPLPPNARRPRSLRERDREMATVTFEPSEKTGPTVGKGFPEREPGALPPSSNEMEVYTLSAQEAQKLFKETGHLKRSKQMNTRKPSFKYCYECGRSVGVRLAACTRCKEVYYCSKVCKLKAWTDRHKEECIRIGVQDKAEVIPLTTAVQRFGIAIAFLQKMRDQRRSRSPSPSGRRGKSDSPTPATDLKGKKATVHELTKDKRAQRINVPVKGLSKSAKTAGRTVITDIDDKFKRAQSERFPRKWVPPPGVTVDNYSYV